MTSFIAEIIDIRKETHDVKTFRLTKPGDFSFIAGQYCLVSFIGKPEFFEESRPFTFSNDPTQKDFIELTIKEMGDFTQELFKLKKGDKLKIDGPKGEALNFDESIKNIVFLAGGSGITPFISAIRYVISKNLPNKMILLFSNRTENDIIFKQELEKFNKNNNNIKIITTLTDEVPDRWKGETKRIDKEMIKKYVEEPKKWFWYICGPPPMIKAMENILSSLNVPKEKLKIEDWQIQGKSG